MLQAAPSDSLRAVLDRVFSNRAYEWVEPKNPFAFIGRWWRALVDWLGGLEQASPDAYWALIWLLTAVLVAIVVHAVYVMTQTLKAASAPADPGSGSRSPEIHGAAWYRREAARLAREGRYPEAMQADFLGLVLELDQRGAVAFHPSKTPYEYSLEVKGDAPARASFRGLVQALYGYAFAGQSCGPEDFSRWHHEARAERYAAAH
ncbi:MAG: hypothetical protein U0133_05625 [Gemmatimonadales bacterium]